MTAGASSVPTHYGSVWARRDVEKDGSESFEVGCFACARSVRRSLSPLMVLHAGKGACMRRIEVLFFWETSCPHLPAHEARP